MVESHCVEYKNVFGGCSLFLNIKNEEFDFRFDKCKAGRIRLN